VTDRCHICDHEIATQDHYDAHKQGCVCETCMAFCWRPWSGECAHPPVDWRASFQAALAVTDGLTARIERYETAFREAVISLEADGTMRAATCTWCSERWPILEGDDHEAIRRYANDHAQRCPVHPLRIERDRLRTEVAKLTAEVAAMQSVVDVAVSWRTDDSVTGLGLVRRAIDVYRASQEVSQ
jgi:hypothetical protein